MRVLFAPANTSGQGSAMGEAIQRYGYTTETWVFGKSPFGIDCDRRFETARLLADPNYRWDMFDQAVRNFDVFHFMAGRSLLDSAEPAMPVLWDLPLLRLLGKKVVMHFRGSDVRLPSVHLRREEDSYFRNLAVLPDEDAIMNRIAISRRHADSLLVSTPGLLDYVPDAEWVGHVVTDTTVGYPRASEPDVPHVVHIPSSRATKGSAQVELAVQPLVEAGAITYQSITGLTVKQTHDMLRQADIVVDSLTIGDHGLISVEAMAVGCIPIAHIADINRSRNPGVPVVEATGPTLQHVLAGLASDPKRRAALRPELVKWVQTHHSHDAIGSRLHDIYQRPVVFPELHRTDWPVSTSTRHVEGLERRLADNHLQGHPLFAGFGPPARTTPPALTERLTQRIATLESELANAGITVNESVLGGTIRQFRPSVRARLYQHPRLHLRLRQFIERRKK